MSPKRSWWQTVVEYVASAGRKKRPRPSPLPVPAPEPVPVPIPVPPPPAPPEPVEEPVPFPIPVYPPRPAPVDADGSQPPTAAFALTHISPTTVPAAGGTLVHLYGTGFTGFSLLVGSTPVPVTVDAPGHATFTTPTTPPFATGTHTLTAQQGADEDELPGALTVQAPPVGGTVTVAAQLVRFKPGSGTVRVSCGVPFYPGLVPTAADLAKVAVKVLGVEQRIACVSIGAVFNDAGAANANDNSLRSAIVQLDYDCEYGVPLAAEIVIGAPRTTVDIPMIAVSSLLGFAATPSSAQLNNPNGVNGHGDAVILPTNPAYLLGCRVLPESIPVAEAKALGEPYNGYERMIWEKPRTGTVNGLTNPTYGDANWSWYIAQVPMNGNEALARNYYDLGMAYFARWLRTGVAEWYRRGCILTYFYHRLYAYQVALPPYNWFPDGLAAHFLLTGDPGSRTMIDNYIGSYILSGDPSWNANLGVVTSYGGEARPMARILNSYIWARRIGLTNRDYAALALSALSKMLGIGTNGTPARGYSVAGSYGWDDPDSVGIITDNNFQTMLVLESFINYREWVANDARILPAMKVSLDYMITQWDAARTYGGQPAPQFRYEYQNAYETIDIHADFVAPFPYYWREATTDPARADYLAMGETIFSRLPVEPNDGHIGPYLSIGNTAVKQLIEQVFMAWRHVGYRVARRSYP